MKKTRRRTTRKRTNRRTRKNPRRFGGIIEDEKKLNKFYLLEPDDQGYRALYLLLEKLDDEYVNAWSFPPTNYPEPEYSVRGMQIDSLPLDILKEEVALYTLERDGPNKVLRGDVEITFPDNWWVTHKNLWKSILRAYKIKDVR